MILVDTSIWVAFFRKTRPISLTDHLAFDEIVTHLCVIQEVLQGFREETPFRVAREALHALPIVDSPLTTDVVEHGIELYRYARKRGITIRSSVDCLIAASAIRHNLTVAHRDRDFKAIAKISSLKENQFH